MSSTAVPRIDWRRQVADLEPFLAERGGVVRVAVSADSPASTFVKVVRQLMAGGDWERPWISVQIDPDNPNTHYLDDIVAQLAFSLGIEDELALDRGRIVVGSYNRAEKVEVKNVKILHQENEAERSRRMLGGLRKVADAIEERLQTERVGLVFLNSHTYDQRMLARLRNRLWDERLDEMTEMGLLLIDVSDPDRCRGSDWPPDQDLLLELPERFDDGARADAEADLATLALDEGIATDASTAEMFAKTLIQSSDRVGDLYNGLARVRAMRSQTP